MSNIRSLFVGAGVVAMVGLAGGCGSQPVPSPSSEITFEQAMTSVGAGLKNMQDAEGGVRTGLIPDEVDVTFNISASGKNTSSLHLDASSPTVPNAPIKLSSGKDIEISSQRGNQITIKMKNLFYAKDTPSWTAKDAQEIQHRYDVLKTTVGGSCQQNTTGVIQGSPQQNTAGGGGGGRAGRPEYIVKPEEGSGTRR